MSGSITIKIRGIESVMRRMSAFPRELRIALNKTMQAALLVLWESVPGYPPKPAESDYQRTGTLGRTLGSGEGGGKQGTPDIYEVKDNGGFVVGRFGTRLEYAQYVIGDYAEEQASHMRHWWTLPQDVLQRAYPKIKDQFVQMKDVLVKFLKRKEG